MGGRLQKLVIYWDLQEETMTEVPSERIESLSSQVMNELDAMSDYGYHNRTAQPQNYETSSLK